MLSLDSIECHVDVLCNSHFSKMFLLTFILQQGFGDSINCEDSWRTCTDYIDEQFQHYFLAESGLNRRHIQDTRVHCCLYFVPPYGHG